VGSSAAIGQIPDIQKIPLSGYAGSLRHRQLQKYVDKTLPGHQTDHCETHGSPAAAYIANAVSSDSSYAAAATAVNNAFEAVAGGFLINWSSAPLSIRGRHSA
jgi:hypothetical protein